MPEFAAFDSYAVMYDAEFTHSSIGKAQRERVWLYLTKILLPHSTLLEINCGTGADALYFAEKGCNVIATDASAKMIETAATKAMNKTNSENIVFEQCAFAQLKEKYKGKKFDYVFSNFGGLNCVTGNELEKLAADFSFLLNPSGSVIFVIMGTNCKWEQLYFTLKGNRKNAFRRRNKQGATTVIKDATFTTYYFSPFTVKQIFYKLFEPVKVLPIGLFVPPSYLQPFFEKRNTLLKLLSFMETLFGSIPLFSNAADHYLIHLKLRENAERV